MWRRDVSGLNVGDTVLCHRGRNEEIRTVARLTKTLIVLDDGNKYSRKTGWQSPRSDNYWGSERWIEPVTPEQIEAIRQQKERERELERLHTVLSNAAVMRLAITKDKTTEEIRELTKNIKQLLEGNNENRIN